MLLAAAAGVVGLLVLPGGGHKARAPGSTPHTARSATAARSDSLRHLIQLGLPIYCAGSKGRDVALTFDDGPGPYTNLAIDKLRRAHERATFFLVGRNVPGHEQLVKQELTVGELGDHTYTHPWLPSLDPAGVREEITRARDAITGAAAVPVTFFRPPYEGRTREIDAEAQALGMLQILWDVDSRDSAGADHNGIARNVIRGLQPGSIVLMHENRGQTIRALRKILPALRRRHLRAVGVSELLMHDPPSDAQVVAGAKGCPLIARAARTGG